MAVCPAVPGAEAAGFIDMVKVHLRNS